MSVSFPFWLAIDGEGEDSQGAGWLGLLAIY